MPKMWNRTLMKDIIPEKRVILLSMEKIYENRAGISQTVFDFLMKVMFYPT